MIYDLWFGFSNIIHDEHILICLLNMNFQALAIKTCNRVCQWVKDVENEIFLLGASPFSW